MSLTPVVWCVSAVLFEDRSEVSALRLLHLRAMKGSFRLRTPLGSFPSETSETLQNSQSEVGNGLGWPDW